MRASRGDGERLPAPTDDAAERLLPERAWVDDFIEQLAAFPRGDHDDDVDAFSQLFAQWHGPTLSASDILHILSIGESDEPSWIERLGEPPLSKWPKIF